MRNFFVAWPARSSKRRLTPLLAAVVLLAGCPSPPSAQLVEPAHKVVYSISTAGQLGATPDSMTIEYTGSSGSVLSEETPSPAWRTEVTTKPGVTNILLAASGRTAFGRFDLKCSVTIDGVERTNRGPSGCRLSLSLEQLRPALEAAKSQSPMASPTATAAPTQAPPPPPSPTRPPPDDKNSPCRYVTNAEVDSVAASAGRRDGLSPIRYPAVVGERCQYVFQGQGTVAFWWEPGGKLAFTTAVPELDVPAFWNDYGDFTTLDVQLRSGLFHVRPSFTFTERSDVDQRVLAIGFFKAARPRLK